MAYLSHTEVPFSFHCVICIEPFNLNDRPPVILPCGHTYICEPCSKRLKKCMECRTSLFIKPPAATAQHHGMSTPSSSSGWHQPSPSTPISPRNRSTYSIHRERYNHYQSTPIKKPPPVELIPLPIPKNHVMLALMEAAERRERAVQDDNSDSDAEEYDDTHRVLNGIESMSSVCGTYVVRDNEGLAVFEKNPHDLTLKKIPSYLTPPPMLRYGQRVQVVGMENDVYKLARNEGYVVADHTQLVKVGVPLEESCKVEGLIRTVQSHKANLHKKLQGLEQAEDNLKFELDELLDKPPQHPVIEDFRTVLPMELEEEEEEHLMEEDSILGEDYHREGLEIGLSLSEESLTGTPTPSSPPGPAALSRQVLFLNDEETAISDTMSDSGMRRRSESPITRGTFICGGSLFPALRSTISDDDDASRRSQRIRRVGSSDLEDASTRDPDRVDFRTGLSGHIALNIPKRSHTALQKRRNVVRLMGEHRGIAPMRNMRKRLTDSPH